MKEIQRNPWKGSYLLWNQPLTGKSSRLGWVFLFLLNLDHHIVFGPGCVHDCLLVTVLIINIWPSWFGVKVFILFFPNLLGESWLEVVVSSVNFSNFTVESSTTAVSLCLFTSNCFDFFKSLSFTWIFPWLLLFCLCLVSVVLGSVSSHISFSGLLSVAPFNTLSDWTFSSKSLETMTHPWQVSNSQLSSLGELYYPPSLRLVESLAIIKFI